MPLHCHAGVKKPWKLRMVADFFEAEMNPVSSAKNYCVLGGGGAVIHMRMPSP